MNKKNHIGIAGNIGVGKTTLCKKLSEIFLFEPIYESVIENPFLVDFYKDMERWSFNLQVYFLWHRFSNQIKLKNYNKGFIQDRTIYEDKEIYAKNLYNLGHMTNRDYSTYCALFNSMLDFIEKPDLIIYLRANTDTLMSRIKQRNRDYELEMSSEYIHSLNIYYDKWINNLNQDSVLIIDTNNFNIFKDIKKYNSIVSSIKNKLNEI